MCLIRSIRYDISWPLLSNRSDIITANLAWCVQSPDVPGWDTYIQPILDFCEKHVNGR